MGARTLRRRRSRKKAEEHQAEEHRARKRAPRRDVYQDVTDRVIAALEAGTIPWVRPWKGGEVGAHGRPVNVRSAKPYNGINVMLLWLTAAAEGYSRDLWLTFRQAKALGGSVRKGEHGTRIVFWKFREYADKDSSGAPVVDPETGEARTRRVPMARLYTVFNVDQCDGLTLPKRFRLDPADSAEAADAEADLIARDTAIEEFLAATGAAIEHRGSRACYSPDADRIRLPKLDAFNDSGAYYATALHELTHWTGHKSRCDRDFRGRFDSDAYAVEELVAEMGSAFLCARFAVEGKLQHPSYLAHWVKVLRADNGAIVTAASKARIACEYLYELTGDTPAEVEDDPEGEAPEAAAA
jgi:antirestriction protein ArdC